MSKKKAKAAKKKPVKKVAKKTAAKKTAAKKKTVKVVKKAAAVASSVTRMLSAGGNTKRTTQATIFITEGAGGLQIRTAPQYITAGPGFVEWTVVNLTGSHDIPVEISFPKGGPWGGEKITIRDGWIRRSCHDAMDGNFKYTVSAGGASEDPEIEIPEN
jgi:hypothetical protein